MQVVVEGLLVNYEMQGKGQTVLFVHGWADRLETFNSITPGLSQSYKVLSLDLPGFGQTEAPKTVWNLDDYARFIAEFIKKVGPHQNVRAIIGHSNGAAVAIRGIALGILTPQKLILLSSSGVRDTAKLRRFVIKLITKIGKVATFWLPLKIRQQLQKKLYGTVGSDMLVTPALQETFKTTVRQDIQLDAKQLTLPTLLIYGDKDTATPLESVGQSLHKLIRNSRLEVIPGADHFVHHANPMQVTSFIQEFLKK